MFGLRWRTMRLPHRDTEHGLSPRIVEFSPSFFQGNAELCGRLQASCRPLRILSDTLRLSTDIDLQPAPLHSLIKAFFGFFDAYDPPRILSKLDGKPGSCTSKRLIPPLVSSVASGIQLLQAPPACCFHGKIPCSP
jgi:hypothetical protein